MLSLSRGKPFATALDKDNKRVLIIHSTNEQGEPDIKVDEPIELITDADIEGLRKHMKLGKIEVGIIKKFLKEKNKDTSKLSAKLQRAIEILLGTVDTKLKKELDLSLSEDNLRFLPLIGKGKDFDRSFYVVGASESGKSHFIADVLANADVKQRPCILFSSIENDSSLDKLRDQKTKADKKEKLIQVPLLSIQDCLNLPTHSDLKNTVCVFDDIDSLSDLDMQEFVRQYRDNMLQNGRHDKISVMSTSHQLNNYNKTKQMLTQAEWVVCFPASNKAHTVKFLKNYMGMEKKDIDNIVENAVKHGRFLCAKLSAPQLLMTQKMIRLI